jgi:Ca2+-binding RTX toxin-like protein
LNAVFGNLHDFNQPRTIPKTTAELTENLHEFNLSSLHDETHDSNFQFINQERIMAQVVGSNFSDRVFGTNDNDDLFGLGGNDNLAGFAGDDLLAGGTGYDTADYSRLGRAVTLLPGGRVSKGRLGTDQMDSIERIVGTAGLNNSIDGAGGSGSASFDVDLGAKRLTVNNVPFLGTLNFSVHNFLHVRGTPSADRITGSGKGNFLDGQGGNDTLTGSAGSDTLVGGSGIDLLNGADDFYRGFLEVDSLTGGSNNDGFIVGDRSGSYYRFNGFSDYALIRDFTRGDLIQLGAGETYQTRRDSFGFDLFVFRGGVADLVADVRTTSFVSLPSGPFRLASGQVLGGFYGA